MVPHGNSIISGESGAFPRSADTSVYYKWMVELQAPFQNSRPCLTEAAQKALPEALASCFEMGRLWPFADILLAAVSPPSRGPLPRKLRRPLPWQVSSARHVGRWRDPARPPPGSSCAALSWRLTTHRCACISGMDQPVGRSPEMARALINNYATRPISSYSKTLE